ncbi:MAG: Amidase [Bacteroidetes bacterium]|jgi:surface antigen|nr:Amidase [Bacteroidota bacterium]
MNIKKIFSILFIFVVLIITVYFLFFSKRYPLNILSHSLIIGDSVDSFNGVIVYNNGMDYPKSHGKHYNKDSSFYYGKKWQCVEYIKRYYFDHLHFVMPYGMGNAKDFFDSSVKHGELNKQRGLLQFHNTNKEPPKVNDILIFGGKYGHVAIVASVKEKEIEVIQQNIYMTPRETFPLSFENGKYTIGKKRKPNGWLRLPQ